MPRLTSAWTSSRRSRQRALLIACTLLVTSAVSVTARAQPSPSEAVLNAFEPRIFRSASGATIPYRIMAPAADAPASPDGDYPLLVFLHGRGERGDDNVRQLTYLEPLVDPELRRRHPAFVLAPQCPSGKDAQDDEIGWTAGLAPDKPTVFHTEPAEPMALALALLDAALRELRIDCDRVYVAGLSMGGYGTWDLAARRPEQVAAIAPICGGADVTTAGRIARIPTWIFHGDADPVVPVEKSRQMAAALRALGAKPILTEYPGVGHDSWRPALRERLLWDWLFAQRRSQ